LPGWGELLESFYSVTVGGFYALALDQGSWTTRGVSENADALVAARGLHPIDFDSLGNPYVERNGQPGKQSSELFYVGDFQAQTALTGGLLHLAASHYMRHMRQAMERSSALHHHLPQHMPWVGLVEAGPGVGVLLDIPFIVRPQRLLLDVRGLFMGFHDQATGVYSEGFPHVATLTAFEVSAREHVTWEELTDFEAISTVKGLQVRSEQANDPQSPDPGGELLVVTPANADAIADAACNELQFVQKSVCGNPADVRLVPGNLTKNDLNPPSSNYTAMGCTDLDLDTYCRIKNEVVRGARYLTGSTSLKTQFQICTSFGADGCCQTPVNQSLPRFYWRALYWDNTTLDCGNALPAGSEALAATELRVARRGVFQYQSWLGAVAFGFGTLTNTNGDDLGRYLSAAMGSAATQFNIGIRAASMNTTGPSRSSHGPRHRVGRRLSHTDSFDLTEIAPND
jgi:hypothetical protein